MKHSIAILLLAIPITVSAQEVIVSKNIIPQPDETIERHEVFNANLSTIGSDVEWDLSQSEVSDASTSFTYHTVKDKKDYVVRIEPHYIGYYLIKNDSLLLDSCETRHVSIKFSEPIDVIINSFSYGDSISRYVQGKGRYLEKTPFLIYGIHKKVCDGKGKLILPGGDTLQHVLRVHHELSFVTIPLESFDQLDSVTVIPNDSISLLIGNANELARETVYQWYTSNNRYPIVESFCLEMSSSPKDVLTYYQPIDKNMDGQETMPLLSQTNGEILGEGVFKAGDAVCSYKIIHTNNSQLHLEFFLPKASISYGLYTSEGMILSEKRISSFEGGLLNAGIDIPSSKKGVVILKLCINNDCFTSKFTIK